MPRTTSASSTSRSFDAILVPGARIYGEVAGPALRRRIERAVEAYDAGLAPTVLISGAGGEAEVGAALAHTLGLPTTAVMLETQATSTRENAAFSAAMVSGRVLIITDDFHVWRCSWLYGAHFAEVEVVGVSGSRWLRPRLREGLSIAKAVLQAARAHVRRASTAK